jgi:hypothetical protein
MAVVVVPQINLFIFDRPPQTLGKDIVETPAFAGHADGDLTLFQFLRKIAASVLLALVRMKNLRRRYPQRFMWYEDCRRDFGFFATDSLQSTAGIGGRSGGLGLPAATASM